MFQQRHRRLYGNNMRKSGILFAVVTSISYRLEGQQLDFLRDDLHFVAQEFLANGFHFPAAFATDQLVFRQFQKHFLFREAVQHLSLTALLPLMLRDQNGIRCRFLRFGILPFFRLIEKTGLVVQNIAVFSLD